MADALYDGTELWEQISAASAACSDGQRKCAVAYVTAAGRLALGPGDVLVVNAGDNAMTQGATSKQALRHYVNDGVTVISVNNLHAKLYVFADTVIVGSANISVRAAQGDSLEVGVVTTSKRVRTQAVEFVDDLTARRQPLTLSEIEALPNRARNVAPDVGDGPEIVDSPGRLWVFWHVDKNLTSEDVAFAKRAKQQTRGTGNWVLHTTAGDDARPGEICIPIWLFDDDKTYGPPAVIVARHIERKRHILILRDLDGYDELDVDPAYSRRRAKLPQAIRDLAADDDQLDYVGDEMTDILELFRV